MKILLPLLFLLAAVACDAPKSKEASKDPHADHKGHAEHKGHDAHKGHGEHKEHKGHDAHKGHEHHGHGHGHAPDPNTIPKDQSGKGKSGAYHVAFTPKTNPIPFQKPFAMEVKVFEDAAHTKPAAGVKLDQVRAIMPAHKHGMKVEPTIKSTAPGVFAVEGMRFHMQGAGDDGKWVLELVLNDGKAVTTFQHDLQCCR